MPTLVNNLRAIRGPITSVPLVAGKGVILEPDIENNQIIVKADETVLWEGTAVSGTTVALSESIVNFERIAFEGYCHNGNTYSVYGEATVYGNIVRIAALTFWPGSPEFDLVKCECSTNSMTCHGTSILYNGQTINNDGTITKVIGINRKANP